MKQFKMLNEPLIYIVLILLVMMNVFMILHKPLCIKGLDHLKMKIMSLITHVHVFSNPWDKLRFFW